MTDVGRRMSNAEALDVTGRTHRDGSVAPTIPHERSTMSRSASTFRLAPRLRGASSNVRNRNRQIRSSSFTASHSQGEKPQGQRHHSIWSAIARVESMASKPQRDHPEHGRSGNSASPAGKR
jgi:hypothetical protein